MPYSRTQINSTIVEEKDGELFINGHKIVDGKVAVKTKYFISIGLIFGFAIGGYVGWFLTSAFFGNIGG